jgi:adenylosuccinate synthase
MSPPIVLGSCGLAERRCAALSNLVVIGAQWGDEGKGKIVDLLTERFDTVVRYQGGANAGHTVVVRGRQFILHQVPSGIISGAELCVAANGVVVDPASLVAELAELEKKSVRIEGRFALSDRAQIVMPYHGAIDRWNEKRLGDGKIGTTGRGIGPAYETKISRSGLRVGDLLDASSLQGKVKELLDRVNLLIIRFYQEQPFKFDEVYEPLAEAGAKLAPHIRDTADLLHKRIEAGSSVIFEGAQGTMLDIDHGTYPYVTSSNTTVGSVCSGTGVPPKQIHHVLGVSKAYCTRVGRGPFPSEDLGEAGERMREIGGEYGATTGRPRRCGWFDAVAVRYASRINGFDALAITKIDVLDGFAEIPVCIAYEIDGKRIEHVPASAEEYSRYTPIYESLPGWRSKTSGIDSYGKLPDAAKRYLDRLGVLLGVPVAIVSTGRDRRESVIREDIIEKCL